MPYEPARSNGEIAPTVHTRISRPCESLLICTASSSICSNTIAARRKIDLCREGTPTMMTRSIFNRARKTAAPRCFLFAKNYSFAKKLIDANLPQQFEIAEHFPRSQHHRSQRIVGNGHRQPGLFANALVEILQQRSATRQYNAAIADVRGKLRRRAF